LTVDNKNQQAAIRTSFRKQAQSCLDLDSPFMQQLCIVMADRLDESDPVGKAVLNWDGDPGGNKDALALRLCGCLHALMLSHQSEALKAVYPPNSANDDALWAACRRISRSFCLHSGKIGISTPNQRNSAIFSLGTGLSDNCRALSKTTRSV